jgi:hypothetical protein
MMIRRVRDSRKALSRAALPTLGFILWLTPSLCAGTSFRASGQSRQGAALIVSPEAVRLGKDVRVLAAAEIDLADAEIVVAGPSGALDITNARSGGGPPFWRSAEARIIEEGVHRAALVRAGEQVASFEFRIPSGGMARAEGRGLWPALADWDRGVENLYSAWLECLFLDADEESSWKALHAVTQDPARNLLYDHLSLGEDDAGGSNAVVMEPDCADAPFFLRAYFAWKLHLPFGFHRCSRGNLWKPPQCQEWVSSATGSTQRGEARAFNYFLRLLLDAIHSGTARTPLEAERSDYYPVPLTRQDLRPGVVFADPYGHTLVLVRWVDQTADRSGRILAMDAQPDGTIGLRRFWPGNFLFNTVDVIGDPGFKAFRPIIRVGGAWRPMTNEEIQKSPDYANFSLQQKKMESSEFYDIMDRVINPHPLDPETAFHDVFSAFQEQLQTRVLSIANGEEYKAAHPGVVIPMPGEPAAVFQSIGLWEDYSTPNRDMRLLIAVDVLLGFPEKLLRSPGSFRFPQDKTPGQVKKELESLAQTWAREMTITYTRSDGRPQRLTIGDVLDRREALEMGYNPNDCVEVRWGAPEGNEETSTCRRRAPAAQLEKMRSLRHWFHERRRPPT